MCDSLCCNDKECFKVDNQVLNAGKAKSSSDDRVSPFLMVTGAAGFVSGSSNVDMVDIVSLRTPGVVADVKCLIIKRSRSSIDFRI